MIASELAAWRSPAGVWSKSFAGRGTMEDLTNDFAFINDEAEVSALLKEAKSALKL